MELKYELNPKILIINKMKNMELFESFESFDFVNDVANPGKTMFLPKDINDKNYIEYLKIKNGGYYFNNAIHVYGFSDSIKHHDLYYINKLIKSSFEDMSEGYFFGEDLFGNLFGFHEGKIIFFDIETAEIEVIADSFLIWADLVLSEVDYYCAPTLIDQITIENVKSLSRGYRISAILPFVLGGEYKLENLVLKNFEENISFNASIAKQIKNKPDGEQYVLKIKT